jgi:conjugal transfer ATP-binding protein TraC
MGAKWRSFWERLPFSIARASVTVGELEKDLYRVPFSRYLPWIAYDPETHIYYNCDQTVGFLWECIPLTFAGENTLQVAAGMLRFPLPDFSVLQFILLADDCINDSTRVFLSSKTVGDELVHLSAQETVRHLEAGRGGLSNNAHIPVRNFRLFVALKVPVPSFAVFGLDLEEVRTSMTDILTGMQIAPRLLDPSSLLAWQRRMFNDTNEEFHAYYDLKDIRSQVINAETEIVDEGKRLRVGEKIYRCVTPKSMPHEVGLLQSNELTGGVWGMSNDMDQIKTPFLYSTNIIWQNMRAALHFKTNIVLSQSGFGSFARGLGRKQEEYASSTDQLEKGERFFRMIPTCWVWGKSVEEVDDSVSRVKRIYSSHGYVMQEDHHISKVLFVASLPFGMYSNKKTNELLERDFIAPAEAILPTLPIQADFGGSGPGPLVYVGRKGQIIGLDVFDSRASNHNLVCFASPGGGKSFAVGHATYQYYGTGAKVRIIDIGRSYEKQTKLVHGMFLDFTDRSRICLNPFTTITSPEHDLPVVAMILLRMAYCSSLAAQPSQVEETLAKEAANWAWTQSGSDALIDEAWEFLRMYPKYCADSDAPCVEQIVNAARTLAFNLSAFIKDGIYGSIFHGRSTFDLSSEQWAVLELSGIRARQDLFNVISLIMIDATSRELYGSGGKIPTIIVCDEAHQFLVDGAIIRTVMSDLYRKARKSLGSAWIISQSVLDLKLFGGVGEVIWNSSAFRLLLQSSDYDKALAENLINFGPLQMALLKRFSWTPRISAAA